MLEKLSVHFCHPRRMGKSPNLTFHFQQVLHETSKNNRVHHHVRKLNNYSVAPKLHTTVPHRITMRYFKCLRETCIFQDISLGLRAP